MLGGSSEELTVRIAGPPGNGLASLKEVFCALLRGAGLSLLATRDDLSRIFGGTAYFQVRISSKHVDSMREKCDVCLALDSDSVKLHLPNLVPRGLLIADPQDCVDCRYAGLVDVPLNHLAGGGDGSMAAFAACGVLAALLQLGLEVVTRSFTEHFASRGPAALERATSAAAAGYLYYRDSCRVFRTVKIDTTAPAVATVLLSGSEAVAMAALGAGCGYCSSSPVIPSTNISDSLARLSGRFGLTVEAGDDGEAAVRMAIRSSLSGVRSMCTGSFGPEGLRLVMQTGSPVVMVDNSFCGRPVLRAGTDGRYSAAGPPHFVLAPGSVAETFRLTARAFDIAADRHVPVIVAVDHYLAGMLCTERIHDLAARSGGPAPDTDTKEGRDCQEARNPHIFAEGINWSGRERFSRAATVLLCSGSAYGPVREVATRLASRGVSYLHFSLVWPFPSGEIESLTKGKRLIAVEHETDDWLAQLMQEQAGLTVDTTLRTCDGGTFTTDFLERSVLREIG